MGAGAFIFTKNVWLVEIWRHNSGPALQICGFTYGIGNILGPLIDRPFVSGDKYNETILSNGTNEDSIDISDSTRSRLLYPFIITGAIQLIGELEQK